MAPFPSDGFAIKWPHGGFVLKDGRELHPWWVIRKVGGRVAVVWGCSSKRVCKPSCEMGWGVFRSRKNPQGGKLSSDV